MADTYECEGEGCNDSSTDTSDVGNTDGYSTAVPKTYCPFRDTLTVGADGVVTVTTNLTQYADGNYNQITLTDGCVAGLSNVESRGYVPSICCDTEPTTVPGADIQLSPDTCNLTSLTGGQLMTSVQFSATGDYQVTGCGTTANPFKIQGPTIPDASIHITPCVNSASVTVTGAGTASNPLKVCHKTSPITAGTYGGFTVDGDGHITAYDDTNVPGNPKAYTSDSFQISATSDPDVCTIEKKAVTTAGTADYAGFEISYNEFGEITNIVTPAATPLTTTVDYAKSDGTFGTLTFTDGVLTGQS